MLNEKEKQEWLELSTSQAYREDMRYLKSNKHNPFLKNGEVNLDKLIEFLTISNEFFNHQRKPFKPMIDEIMKL